MKLLTIGLVFGVILLLGGCDTSQNPAEVGSAEAISKPPSMGENIPNCYFDCTHTIGFWKTHGVIPKGNNAFTWNAYPLTLGLTSYDEYELLEILNEPVKGNGLVSLAHQLIGANLNTAAGAPYTPVVMQAIDDANTLIGAKVVPPIGSGYLAPTAVDALVKVLTDYNEGLIPGISHCSDEVAPE